MTSIGRIRRLIGDLAVDLLTVKKRVSSIIWKEEMNEMNVSPVTLLS